MRPTLHVPALAVVCTAAALAGAVPTFAHAQGQTQTHEHTAGMTHGAAETNTQPTQTGQAAFAAIAEVVRMLAADPGTDWSMVNLEALRQHLRDMDMVLMQSRVVQSTVEGGVRLEVTGEGATMDAIRRMLRSHGSALEGELPVRATVAHHEQGLVLTVVARDPDNADFVARLRGLGFAGLLVTGDHHGPHHVMIARGQGASHSDHGKP